MRLATFAKDALLTAGTKLVSLAMGILISVLLARGLGPEGKGIYALAVLFPTLIATFVSLGVGPATVYHVAQGKYSLGSIFNSNIMLSLTLGLGGSLSGLALLTLAPSGIFPEVPRSYLLMVLALVPLSLFQQQTGSSILLGARRIKEYNSTSILSSLAFLLLLGVAMLVLKAGVVGAILANVLSSVLVCMFLFVWIQRISGTLSFQVSRDYMRDVLGYGLKAHIGNVIGFLNYRIEIFLLGILMPAAAIGFYSVAVGLAERLWLVSQSVSTLIFPLISAEADEQKRKEFTPIISRSVFLITGLGATTLYVLSRPLVLLLYSHTYLTSAQLLRILLPGIVFLSVSRILANDVAGRGKPLLNSYVGGATLAIQVSLNLALIPRFGATGSAWATTISYGLTLVLRLWVYARISGNPMSRVILPQKSDVALYRQLIQMGWKWTKKQVSRV